MERSRPPREESPVDAGAEHAAAFARGVRPERRATGRRVLRAPIAARVKGLHFGRVLDISRRGALADTVAILRPLESSELVIRFPDGPLVARATVRRCRAWGHVVDVEGTRFLYYRSGLEFGGLSLQQIDLLERQLLALEAEAAAPHLLTPPAAGEQATVLVERRIARSGGPFLLRELPGGPPKKRPALPDH